MSNNTLDSGITLPADYLETDSYKEHSAESIFGCEGPEPLKEQALWQAVIRQAVLDATSAPTNSIARKEKTRAIIWFSMQDKDFLFVCEMAGMNPAFVLDRARKAIKNSSIINKRKLQLKRIRKARYMSAVKTDNGLKRVI